MISVKDLHKRFDEFTAIAYDDMQFNDGESYVLLGASGCGKSTYLNMLAGVISPTGGSIEIDHKPMQGLSQKQKDAFRVSHIGYIFQDFRLIEDMSVDDNIDILRLEGVDVSAKDEILRELGILDKKNRRVKRLSGGEKQRVAIARALVKKPDIILADEPTGNLNYQIGRKVMEELIRAAKGKTLICVTHDDRLSELFDHVIDMNAMAHGMGGDENA
ncbi:MAG: ABC transporter ATP-binding protein [Clostridia bacterium]|nr:ABC transporter ATP-binding protein [Clostridia bacterium]MBQ9408711.1 ABC transporter ATP-binding protein [Clostridia bacterium]